MDFGIARLATSNTITQASTVFGTAAYLAPEQAQGHRVDGRADVYGLGVVLYEMLAGRVPFGPDTALAVASKHVFERAGTAVRRPSRAFPRRPRGGRPCGRSSKGPRRPRYPERRGDGRRASGGGSRRTREADAATIAARRGGRSLATSRSAEVLAPPSWPGAAREVLPRRPPLAPIAAPSPAGLVAISRRSLLSRCSPPRRGRAGRSSAGICAPRPLSGPLAARRHAPSHAAPRSRRRQAARPATTGAKRPAGDGRARHPHRRRRRRSQRGVGRSNDALGSGSNRRPHGQGPPARPGRGAEAVRRTATSTRPSRRSPRPRTSWPRRSTTATRRPRPRS